MVVILLSTQPSLMLQRNLIYTGITRGKRLAVLVGKKRRSPHGQGQTGRTPLVKAEGPVDGLSALATACGSRSDGGRCGQGKVDLTRVL